MRSKQINDLHVDNLSHEGRGVAQLNDGKTIFIENALPTETVDALVTVNKSNYSEGIACNIKVKSDLREAPECEHFGTCGGCSLQHMNNQVQINTKRKSLLEQIEKFGKTTPVNVDKTIEGPLWNYRNKARLSCKYVDKKGRVLLGFREQQSRYVADLKSCNILNAWFAKNITTLAELIESLSVQREVPQIEISCGDDIKAIIIRHLSPLIDCDIEKIKSFSIEHDLHIYTQSKGPKTIIKVAPEDHKPYLDYYLKDYDVRLKFHPSDFTQINPQINRKMIARALEWLDLQKDDVILDLYCGIGNFSLPLARNQVKSVIGVEACEQMVARASRNAKDNGITNVEFIAADLNENLPVKIIKQHNCNTHFSTYSYDQINYIV